jgi:hypothetical protein
MPGRPLPVLTTIIAICLSAAAQSKNSTAPAVKTVTPSNTNGSTKAPAEKTEREREAERILKARRANAQSLLINLAADARNFNDATVRARTQARVADVLWEVDRERSRAMFRAAWDAAEAADAENRQRQQEDIKQQRAMNGGGGYVITLPPNLRKEVLRLAARRDHSLGEDFLAKLKTQDSGGEPGRKPSPADNYDASVRQRLDLARQLLTDGDTERAMQFADPVVQETSWPVVDFLSSLREKNATIADARYAMLAAAAGANPQSDANTVSMLASYLFTPHVFIGFSSGGTYLTSSDGSNEAPAVSSELRMVFFRAATSILARPIAPPGQDQTSAGPGGDYLVIKRLLPLFEQYAPPEMTAALRTQLEALSPLISESTRQRDDDDLVRMGIRPDNFQQNWETSLEDQIDHAKTSAERDELYFQLASLVAGKGDLKARDYVDKIDDTEMRNSARGYIDTELAIRAIHKKEPDRAQEIVRTGELTHLVKSWTLSQNAKLLAKGDHDRAMALIDEATREARRIETSDADCPRALFGVTNALLLIDRQSAWDVVSDAIQAANAADTFTGEDGELVIRMLMKKSRSITEEPAPDFNIEALFAAFAKENYDKAVELAHGFQQPAPRACATIAIAKSILEEKRK